MNILIRKIQSVILSLLMVLTLGQINTVTVHAEETPAVTLSEDTLVLDCKTKEATLTANVSGSDVFWSSSDTNVVTVEDGKVTEVGIGTATVTVTQEGVGSAECAVTVKDHTWDMDNPTGMNEDETALIFQCTTCGATKEEAINDVGSAASTGTGTESDPYVVTTYDELKTAMTAGGYVKLGGDITFGTTQSDATITISTTVTLDLNGFTVQSGGFYSATKKMVVGYGHMYIMNMYLTLVVAVS